MSITVTSAPGTEPVTSAQVKEWVRADSGDTSQDNRIDLTITAVRQQVEAYLDRSLITQTIRWDTRRELSMPTRRAIFLPRGDVQEITSLTVYDDDAAGTATVYSQGSDNFTVVDSDSTIIGEVVEGHKLIPRNDAWTVSRIEKSIRVIYVAGFGDNATDVPAAIRQAIIRMVATQYEARTDIEPMGIGALRIDDVTAQLLHPYRRGWA